LRTTHEFRPGFEGCLDPDMYIRFHVLFVERSRFTIIHITVEVVSVPSPCALESFPSSSSCVISLILCMFLSSMKLSSFGISSEESGQFRFLRASLTTIKGSVGLILAKVSTMRISIPLYLSSRSFIPLPRFIRSRSLTTLFSSFPRFSSSVFCLSDI
jgi:hypothetical protein